MSREFRFHHEGEEHLFLGFDRNYKDCPYLVVVFIEGEIEIFAADRPEAIVEVRRYYAVQMRYYAGMSLFNNVTDRYEQHTSELHS